VDVSIENNRPRFHRAAVAIDVGVAVNPLTIESQCQGGVIFGLSQLMAKAAITLKEGHVEQRNFDGFQLPYMKDTPPTIDVHIVPSSDKPTGCGEPPRSRDCARGRQCTLSIDGESAIGRCR